MRVHDSQAYRKRDVTRERISRSTRLKPVWTGIRMIEEEEEEEKKKKEKETKERNSKIAYTI